MSLAPACYSPNPSTGSDGETEDGTEGDSSGEVADDEESESSVEDEAGQGGEGSGDEESGGSEGSGEEGGDGESGGSEGAEGESGGDEGTTTETGGDETGGEDTSGEDTGGDDTTAGELPCPETHRCVESIPESWAGPISLTNGDVSSVAAGCGEGYPTELLELSQGLTAGEVECGCSCEAPGDSVCIPEVTVDLYSSGSCVDPKGVIFRDKIVTDECGSVVESGNSYASSFIVVGDMEVDPQGCVPKPTESIPSPAWEKSGRVCEGETHEGVCEDTNLLCVPHGLDDGGVCIFREGEHVCPAGSYSQRSLFYKGFDDSRDCSACLCGEPEGECKGSVKSYDGGIDSPGCNDENEQWEITETGTCGGVPSTSHWKLVGSPTFTGSCGATGGEAMGSLAPIEPVTICCAP